MTIGLVFSSAATPVLSAPNRTDIAFFAGYVARRRDVPLPATVRAELRAAGWIDGPWRRSESALESALQLPITLESWDAFAALFAWESRPLRASGGAGTCATYLGAAIRSFFANGGRRAILVRTGDPWPFIEDGKRRADRRRDRIRALLPGFADVAATPFDPLTPPSWRGLHHVYGIPDATLIVLPDLPDACASEPLPAPAHRDPPVPPEGFVECSEDEPAPPTDNGLTHLPAPRSDSAGYAAWGLAAAGVRSFLARHRRDCLFIGALPLPDLDNRRPGTGGAVYAESELLAYLRRVSVLEDENVRIAPSGTAASAFVQLGWPWLATRRTSDLPEGLEPPDGVLSGLIAAAALARGTFRSVAGTLLPDVIGGTPVPQWGFGADSPGAALAERICVIAREPDGWALVSDVTTSPDVSWRPGGVSRLVASVLRAARRLGESMVFDPNGPVLWTRLRRSMEELLGDYWREGGLRGETSAEAFDVRCDRSTMTQSDLDAGRLVAEITVVPATAIERIVIVLALEAGNAAAVELRAVA